MAGVTIAAGQQPGARSPGTAAAAGRRGSKGRREAALRLTLLLLLLGEALLLLGEARLVLVLLLLGEARLRGELREGALLGRRPRHLRVRRELHLLRRHAILLRLVVKGLGVRGVAPRRGEALLLGGLVVVGLLRVAVGGAVGGGLLLPLLLLRRRSPRAPLGRGSASKS